RTVLQLRPNDSPARASLVNFLMARCETAAAEDAALPLEFPINPIRATHEEYMRRQRSGIAREIPLILINTVPKSASESIWNRLAEGLDLAQGHLSLCLFPDCCLVPARLRAARQGGLVAKEHLLATRHNLSVLESFGIDRMVVHLRDPRQVALSWAHFVRDDVSMRLMAPIWRRIVPPAATLRAELPELLDWSIEHFLPQIMAFISGWTAVAADEASPMEILFLDFETFLQEPQSYFERLLTFYGLDPEGFRQDAEAETVHLRKGETEEWRRVFTPAQQARAFELIPKVLADRFGWEA
ncbi:MAG TPA: sulfotransferase domain-containing protein, partial [Kiloniellaceae bacterium]|nr:sulfotransferase domain-containing protein [Kiloniellaceae bacterium]